MPMLYRVVNTAFDEQQRSSSNSEGDHGFDSHHRHTRPYHAVPHDEAAGSRADQARAQRLRGCGAVFIRSQGVPRPPRCAGNRTGRADQLCGAADYWLYSGGERLERALLQGCARAQANGMPIMIHTGTSIFPGARDLHAQPMLCDDVCVDYPNLVVILAHGGRPLWMNEAFFLVRRHKNMY